VAISSHRNPKNADATARPTILYDSTHVVIAAAASVERRKNERKMRKSGGCGAVSSEYAYLKGVQLGVE
jgi:hypothetical protein